ncbi:frizzled-4-like isoform X2 [Agrilus planipennis]|nr:frizzled-4-like isoform X2 [Agrilus planipennis]
MFVCSVFVPLCSEHVPGAVPACRGLCEEVHNSCQAAIAKAGLTWPAELNCSRFPEPPDLCMQQPPENGIENTLKIDHAPTDFLSAFAINPRRCPTNTVYKEGRCVKECTSQVLLKDTSKKVLYEVWTAVWSLTCLLITTFALLTFFIQPKRFRWPARPILYLALCGFIRSLVTVVQWIVGPLTCVANNIEKPTENLSCVCFALIIIYIDVAVCLWWSVFCFVWYLTAAKEWSTEAIENISTRLHALIWTLSMIPIINSLMYKNIESNKTFGFCFVSSSILIIFELCTITLGCALALMMSTALKNVRKALVCAGRSPYKLERLILRLSVISVGICVPLFVSLLCNFFDNFVVLLMKIAMQFLSAIFASLWVFSEKTFKSWNKVLKPVFRHKSQTVTKV